MFIMIPRTFILAVSLVFLFSCQPAGPGKKPAGTKQQESTGNVQKAYYDDGTLKAEVEVKDRKRHGVTKNYRADGSLLSTIEFREGKKHGKACNYYTNGSKQSEIDYVNGIKHGESKWFHKNGQFYRVTPYVNGKITGIRRKYYDNGALLSECPYKKGFPGVGLKEYTKSGRLKYQDLRIEVREINRLETENKMYYKLSLSDGSTRVKFYLGDLTEGMYMNNNMSPISTSNGVGTLDLALKKGYTIQKNLKITAEKITPNKNHLILQRNYAIDAVND